MKSLEILYDYIEEPEKAKILIAQKPPLRLTLAGFLTGSFGLALWKCGEGANVFFFFMAAGFFFLWDMGFSFLLAAVIDLFISMSADSQVAALNRPADSLFAYFGLADFCWALAAPVAIFSRLGSWAYWPAFAALMGIGFLHLALKARGIRSVYGFSWILSWITLLLPYILSAVFLVCLSFLAVGSFLLR